MLATAAWLLIGAVLLAAAALKAADRTGTTVALAAYGVPGRLAAPAFATLVAVEAALAAALIAGVEGAPYAAAAVLALFLGAQVVALAQGNEGAPCGCFGSGGRLTRAAAARTALLACACAVLPLLGNGPQVEPVLAAAAVAAIVVLAAGRRGAPRGALEIDGEGPPLNQPSALAAWFDDAPVGPAAEPFAARWDASGEPAGSTAATAIDPSAARPDATDASAAAVAAVIDPAAAPQAPGDVRLALFTSPGCALCKRVAPAAEALDGVDVRRFDEVEDTEAWAAARVPGAPYAVALDGRGVVLAKGTANDARQLASIVDAARGRREAPTSRRAFLSRAGGVAASAAGAGMVGAVIRPGDAEAYHFCGHIYTTDGCPHPTGLPRIDRRGLPLRARDGRRVDDLGRLIEKLGRPIDEEGALLTDLDGRPLPAAPRTPVCRLTGARFGIRVKTDGAWYRCCNGRVRKLVDCCSPNDRRINGDRALRGYCYDKRKVFCVMYFQSSVPC